MRPSFRQPARTFSPQARRAPESTRCLREINTAAGAAAGRRDSVRIRNTDNAVCIETEPRYVTLRGPWHNRIEHRTPFDAERRATQRGGAMLQQIGSHARYIQSVLRGTADSASTPDYVKRSWLRCLSQYHLDPQSQREPFVLPREERLARKEQNLELVSFADAEMAHLYHQLAGSGYSIILTDRDGVLLDYYGDLSFRNAAFRTGLVLGAVWSEEYGGTNGMGTCLFERAPLIIHRDQHFFSRNIGLTCCAAPIFDYRGELVAVLDASGESDRAQQHTLVLVNMSAQMIENRLFLNRFKDTFVVRFHSRPELVATWGEGILALDTEGTIAALDRNALFQLGFKSAAELIGAPLERVFNISLSALVGRSQKKSFHALPIY